MRNNLTIMTVVTGELICYLINVWLFQIIGYKIELHYDEKL